MSEDGREVEEQKKTNQKVMLSLGLLALKIDQKHRLFEHILLILCCIISVGVVVAGVVWCCWCCCW